MADMEAVSLAVHTARGIIVTLGAGLGLSVLGAATVPVHEPIKATLTRLCTWTGKAVLGLLRLLYVATGARLAWGLLVTYAHLGWRGQRHAYVTRGRHRPAYVKRHPAPLSKHYAGARIRTAVSPEFAWAAA